MGRPQTAHMKGRGLPEGGAGDDHRPRDRACEDGHQEEVNPVQKL